MQTIPRPILKLWSEDVEAWFSRPRVYGLHHAVIDLDGFHRFRIVGSNNDNRVHDTTCILGATWFYYGVEMTVLAHHDPNRHFHTFALNGLRYAIFSLKTPFEAAHHVPIGNSSFFT